MEQFPKKNSVEELPTDTIIRFDSDEHRMSAYCQVHAVNFQFKEKDWGSAEDKLKHNITEDIQKYYYKRKFLFKRFEEGIKLDTESWYSVIPEEVSKYLCKRLVKSNIKKLSEPFCGAGGITVHLCDTFKCYKVNDLQRQKIQLLRNNMQIYGKKEGAIEIECKNFLELVAEPMDALIICPPWGAIKTLHYSHRDLDEIMKPKLSEILLHAKRFTSNIMLQMPKETSIPNLIKVLHSCRICPIFTVEKIQTNGYTSQLFFYFGHPSFTLVNNALVFMKIYNTLGAKLKKHRKAIHKEFDKNFQTIFQKVYKVDAKLPQAQNNIQLL